jgi:arginine-tRNA-protein transferase
MKTESPLPVLMLGHYPHPCSYFDDREAQTEFTIARQLSAANLERLLEMGFRRSGRMVYRPNCASCHDCQSIRVLVQEFEPDRSMRRTWRANQDLAVHVGRPRLTDEKCELYERYLAIRHEREPSGGLEEFLYESPVESREIEFRLAGKLVSVAIADVLPSGLSAVYCYFDPELATRGLGTHAILWEIDYCRRRNQLHLYLGYYIRDCRKMNYKNRFVPHEILSPAGSWARHEH